MTPKTPRDKTVADHGAVTIYMTSYERRGNPISPSTVSDFLKTRRRQKVAEQ
jgi:hypothetical protein